NISRRHPSRARFPKVLTQAFSTRSESALERPHGSPDVPIGLANRCAKAGHIAYKCAGLGVGTQDIGKCCGTSTTIFFPSSVREVHLKFEKKIRRPSWVSGVQMRSEEHTSELQSRFDLVCRLLLEKKKKLNTTN